MPTPDPEAQPRVRAMVEAGYRGEVDALNIGLTDSDEHVRAMAIAGLHRCGYLATSHIETGLADTSSEVRRRTLRLSLHYPEVSITELLEDPDPSVIEVAAWACGERAVSERAVNRLAAIATDHDDPLCRESAAAALGALGHPNGLDAVLAACRDRPTVRRRAVLALAAFDGPTVDAALKTALEDIDWQVRQAAEDLLEVRRSLTPVDEFVDPSGLAPNAVPDP